MTIGARVVRRVHPSILWIAVTYKCNSMCSHCYAQNAKDLSCIDPHTISGIMHLLSYKYIKHIVLIGGEPTLYHDLNSLIALVKGSCDHVSCVSNGTIFRSDDTLVSLRQSGLSRIDISIGNEDGFFDISGLCVNRIDAINRCVNVFGIDNVSAVMSIGVHNEDRTRKLIDMLHKSHVANVAINVVIPPVNQNAYATKESLSVIAYKIESAYSHIRNNSTLRPLLYLNIPLCLFTLEFVNDIFTHGYGVTGCHVISGDGIVIDPSGNLLPCTHWLDIPWGNLHRQYELFESRGSFDRLWSHGAPRAIAEQLCQYRSYKCIDCRLYGTYCLGSCPLLWRVYSADEEIKGWNR